VKISSVQRPTDVIAAGDANQAFDGNTSWIWYNYDPKVMPQLPASDIVKPDYSYAANPPVNKQTNHDLLGVDTGLRYRHMERAPNTSGFVNVVFVDGHADKFGVNQVQVRNFLIDQ
jgi:prepilin-type processing-associated H-X9-DG protein